MSSCRLEKPGIETLTGHAAERLFPLHCHEDRYRKPFPLLKIIPATIFSMDLSYFIFNYYSFLLFCICSELHFFKCCGCCSTIFSSTFSIKNIYCVLFFLLQVYFIQILCILFSVTHTFSMCVYTETYNVQNLLLLLFFSLLTICVFCIFDILYSKNIIKPNFKKVAVLS